MSDKDYIYKIFEASPIPTTILSGKFPNILIKEANAAYIELTGRSRDEIIGFPFFITTPHPAMYLDKEGLTNVEQSIKKVCLEKTVVKTPVQKFLKPVPNSSDFETLYLEAINTPVLTAEGEIDFIIRTLQNITDFMLAVEKEKEKDRRLIENERFLNESQQVAKIGSWEMDSTNKFYWSDIHYEIMEVEPGTEITVNFGIELLKGQKDRDTFARVYKNAVEKGEYFDVELNIVTPKGNERWIRFTGRGELHNGVFVRMYGVGLDITDQKLVKQQLLDSRNQLNTLIQTVEGVMFECDAESLAFTFVSEQVKAFLGYSPQECIGKPLFFETLFHPDDKEEISKRKFNRINAGKNFTDDYRVRHKDGTTRWIKVSVSVIHENGTPKWLRGLMMDITIPKRILELERIEKEVLELNARSSETTVNVLKAYLQGFECIFPEMQCAIMEVKNGQLHNWVANSLPQAYLAAINCLPIADNTGSCGTAAFKKTKVITSDISTDIRWANYKEIAIQNNLRSCWSQPLKNSAGEVMATLAIYYNTVKSPTEEEFKLIDRAAYLLQLILQGRRNVEMLEDTKFLMEQSQELAHFGSIEYDVVTSESIWSAELFNIFGIEKSIKPTTDLYFELLHPEDFKQIKAISENFLRTKEDYVSEVRIIRPAGEMRILQTWGRVKRDEKGEAAKVIAAYLDVTESKKIQEDLLASESRLRSLLDSQTNYVIRIDFNGNYTYANKKYIDDFGLAKGGSLIGTNSLATVSVGQLEKITKISQLSIAHPGKIFEIELEKHGRDGSIKHSFWHFVGLANSKGESVEIQCVGIDISDRKKAEQEREKKAVELKASEKKYSDLFHLSPQPMWLYDPHTLAFLAVNNATLEQYGFTRDEFLSMTIKDIRPVNELPKLEQAIKKRKKKNVFFQGIFIHQTKSGELLKVDVKRNKIPFKGKEVHLVLANNITEPLKYLDALEKQNLRLAEIAWLQSHVVRAPLARIMGLINIIQNDNTDSTEQDFILKSILSSAFELDAVIHDIVTKTDQIYFPEK